jgi:hypothetical protein
MRGKCTKKIKLYGFCSGLKKQPEKARGGYTSSESSGAVSNEQERGGFNNNPGTSRYEQEIINKQRFPGGGGSNTFSLFPPRNAVATTTTTTTSDHHLKNSYGAVIISDADDVELHEVQDTNPQPPALHAMIQLLSMFNFMKVKISYLSSSPSCCQGLGFRFFFF